MCFKVAWCQRLPCPLSKGRQCYSIYPFWRGFWRAFSDLSVFVTVKLILRFRFKAKMPDLQKVLKVILISNVNVASRSKTRKTSSP